jgi:hypothetical protein
MEEINGGPLLSAASSVKPPKGVDSRPEISAIAAVDEENNAAVLPARGDTMAAELLPPPAT